MPDPITLSVDVEYLDLKKDLARLITNCEGRPLLASYAVPLQVLFGDVDTTAAQEWKLFLEYLRAEVAVFVADEDLDRTVKGIIHALLVIVLDDRTHPLWVHYMANTTPQELVEPILAEELETVRKWVPDLQATPHPSLAAFAKVLAQQVDTADLAVKNLSNAEALLESFREIGGRKTLVDTINAARKITHGDLAALLHTHPEASLPKDLADRFFSHDKRVRNPSSKELKAKRASLMNLVAKLDERITAAEKRDQDKAAKKQKKADDAKDKKIAEAEKKAAKALAELAELKGGPTGPEGQDAPDTTGGQSGPTGP